MNQFVSRLNELPKNSGNLQQDICRELGISKKKLSKCKTGYNQPNRDDLMILAMYFNVSGDYLLGLEDESVLN